MQTSKITSVKLLSQFLTKTLKTNNINIKQSKILEVISHYYQYNDWNSFVAIEKKKHIKKVDAVFFNFFEGEDFLTFSFYIEDFKLTVNPWEFLPEKIYKVKIKNENLTREIKEIYEYYKLRKAILKNTILMDNALRKVILDKESSNISLNQKDFIINENLKNNDLIFSDENELMNMANYIAKSLTVSFDLILLKLIHFIAKGESQEKVKL